MSNQTAEDNFVMSNINNRERMKLKDGLCLTRGCCLELHNLHKRHLKLSKLLLYRKSLSVQYSSTTP